MDETFSYRDHSIALIFTVLFTNVCGQPHGGGGGRVCKGLRQKQSMCILQCLMENEHSNSFFEREQKIYFRLTTYGLLFIFMT